MISFLVTSEPILPEFQSKSVLEDEVKVDSDIPKMFVDYADEDHDALDFVPKYLFDSVLPQIFGYMTHGVSASGLFCME